MYKYFFDNVFGGDAWAVVRRFSALCSCLFPPTASSHASLRLVTRQKVWGPQVLMKGIEWSCFGFYSLLYLLELPVFEQFRAYPPGEPWPWNHKSERVRSGKR